MCLCLPIHLQIATQNFATTRVHYAYLCSVHIYIYMYSSLLLMHLEPPSSQAEGKNAQKGDPEVLGEF